MTEAPDYGRAFGLWRAAAGADWTDYTHHAFTAGLADGSLPHAAFLHYLRQDYVFLIHFARAWALGVVKSDTLEEMRACAGTVHALVEEEMKLHIAACAAHGISAVELEAAEEAPANLAYTRYVLEAGQAGDLADLLAALAPCVLGYGEIGARLAVTADPDTPYRAWIDTYSGTDYQALCSDVGGLIDRALDRRLGADVQASPRWPRLTGRFVTATRLEAGFWQIGLSPA